LIEISKYFSEKAQEDAVGQKKSQLAEKNVATLWKRLKKLKFKPEKGRVKDLVKIKRLINYFQEFLNRSFD